MLAQVNAPTHIHPKCIPSAGILSPKVTEKIAQGETLGKGRNN
jgi:hypothetical protein